MATFDDLSGFTTPQRTIWESDVDEMVRVGGYTHPLFTDPEFASASVFGRRPIPGQGLLLVMGGLVEQSGRFDDTTIGLVGLDDVRFVKPAFADDTLRVEVEVTAREPDPGRGRGLLVMSWTLRNGSDDVLVAATARMLFRLG